MIRNMFASWYKILNNVSIQSKILIFSVIISVVPLFVATALNYNNIAEKNQSSITFSANQVFVQNKRLLENKIITVWNISVTIASDQNIIQPNLSSHTKEYYDDYLVQNMDYTKLLSYMTGFQKYPEILRAILYVGSEHMFSDENTNFFNIIKVKDKPWYQSLINSKNQMIWFPSTSGIVSQAGSPTVTAMRKIKNLNYLPDILGILRIDMPLTQISGIVDMNAITPHTDTLIINSSNDIIYSNNDVRPMIDEGLNYASFESKYADINKWHAVLTKQGEYLVKCSAIAYTDWVMAVMIPKADMLAMSYKTRDDMIIVASITSIIVGILAFLISYSLTRRIRFLASHMQKIDQSVAGAKLEIDSRDELGQLQKSFNAMLNRIQQLMKEEHRLGQEIKSSELKALQAQINPHFLYNTLDLIHWRAMNRNVPEISTIVQALARFYKLCLSRGDETVLLANEIEHVKMYVQIQNERFRNLLKLEITADESVLDCMVLKLLLQPLVENSIIHGIMEKATMEGLIKIKAYEQNDILNIIVEDDGNGMSHEQLRSVLLYSDEKNSEHYGAKNINERIKLLFGQEYGLQYESEFGKGTTVKIALPIVK